MADRNASLSSLLFGKVILQLSRTSLEQLLLGMTTEYPAQTIDGQKIPAITVQLRTDQLKKSGYVS
jgi:hypothetical protein